MVPVYKKVEFLNFLLSKNIITNDIAYSFFKEVNKEPSLLQRIHFTRFPINHMKYYITINATKKYILCRINGKYYKSYRMLRYILRALMENKDMQIAVCIICSRAPYEKQYDKVCSNEDLVNELISSTIVDSILNESQKEVLIKRIDQALDDGDRELFMQLSKQYKDLSI